MKGFIANTDADWYRFLARSGPHDEVNFWQPSKGRPIKTVDAFSPFLFKLKSPYNAICGFGFLYSWQRMPAWYAWEVFGIRNGAPSSKAMYDRIASYRQGTQRETVHAADIGCVLVNAPVFFPEGDWVPQPTNWRKNTVQGATYDLSEREGRRVWEACLDRAHRVIPELGIAAESGEAVLVQRARRLGQGTFRVAVTAAYDNACAVTREHALPVIDAAHIRPYASTADNDPRNGLALRSDLHRLFDGGYITFDRDHRMVVSRHLEEEFQNGRTYYAMEGERLWTPKKPELRPDPAALDWHRDEVFLG